MTTYTRTADGRAFTATEDGRTFTRALDDIMGLDALPVRVNVDGTVTDDIREHRAPEELYGDDDAIRATVAAAGWTLLEGYTGQYGYNGPVLHASEFIGGGLETAILETPGLYAVEVVYANVDEDDEGGESTPAGWVVMRKLEEPHIPALGNSTCAYRLDGLDTDGTPFYLCLTHGELEISPDAPCAMWADGGTPAPLAPLLPGDRVEVDGRERMVTSVISGHHRGRHSLRVAHVAPGDDPWNADVTTIPLPLGSWTEPISPRAIAGRALASAANTVRVAGVIIPETPPAARREYVAARERGETVTDALSRARLEMAADATCGQCGDDRTAVQGEHHGRTVWLCERRAVTCGTCGHVYSDTTPAGRCPREADHPETADLSDLLTVSVLWDDEDMCPVVQIDTRDGAGHVRVNLNDAPIYDADPELSDGAKA